MRKGERKERLGMQEQQRRYRRENGEKERVKKGRGETSRDTNRETNTKS